MIGIRMLKVPRQFQWRSSKRGDPNTMGSRKMGKLAFMTIADNSASATKNVAAHGAGGPDRNRMQQAGI